MAKILKLGFAMGGGVSLGTFCGAALTESIKLAILYGRDSNDQRYEKIVIDVFSGASAGAISLGIMLKALAFPDKDPQRRMSAMTALQDQYSGVNELTDSEKSQLVDAQLAQDLMNDIWVNQIHIDKLLDESGDATVPPLKYQCGIVNRKAVVDIAKENLLPKVESHATEGKYQDSDKANYPLLADRVLFGCSIANLNSLHADATALHHVARNSEVVTHDALTSKLHKEIRIFDINFVSVDTDKFDDTDNHPKRWVRFHWGHTLEDTTFSIQSGKDWKHIVATAVASGSFPYAFEPVTLKRYKWEYPESLWPFSSTSEDYSYVDGGLFNNEPVAEAFRLASHIDALDESGNYERRIIFVDPNVGEKSSMNLYGLYDYQTQKPLPVFGAFDGNDLIRRTSLDKLINHTFSQFAATGEQSEAKEQHKTFQVANKLEMRNNFRKLLLNNIALNNEAFIDLKKEIQHHLSQMSEKDEIPTLPAMLGKEIERLACEPGSNLALLKSKGMQIALSEDLGEFEIQTQKQIMTALVYSNIDLIANLSAKSRNSQLIAIGPFRPKQLGQDSELEKIFLPGSPVAAFAGFMSPIPGEYEVQVAKYCTSEFLRFAQLIPLTTLPNTDPGNFDSTHHQHAQYMNEFRSGMIKLSERVKKMLTDSHLINLGGLNQPLLWAVGSLIERQIAKIQYLQEDLFSVELRVEVEDKDFELDGKNQLDDDRHPIRLSKLDNKLYLICFAQWHNEQKKWQGYNVDKEKLRIDRDGWLVLADKIFVKIPLPNQEQIKRAKEQGYPIFWGKYKLMKNNKPNDTQLADFWQLKNNLTAFHQLL